MNAIGTPLLPPPLTTPTLVIGYGNPGRQDDGLGNAFVSELERRLGRSDAYRSEEQQLEQQRSDKQSSEIKAPHATRLILESAYQLTVEDSLSICDVNQVVFVDASLNLDQPYQIETLEAETSPSIGSHTLTPGGVLALAKALYQHCPRAYVVAIKGYAFDDFNEALSEGASKNLDSALEAFEHYFGLRANGDKQ